MQLTAARGQLHHFLRCFMDITWWQWALIFSAAFLVGLAKTGITGLGILAVAIAASALPARESVGAMLLTLIGGDIFAVLFYRRNADWSHLLRLFPWAAAGVVVGALTLWLGHIDNDGAKHMIGIILLVLILADFARRWFQRGQADSLPGLLKKKAAGGLAGIVAGFTTMVANAAGPVMTLYLLAAELPKMAFLGTSAWFFLVLNLFKIPFSIALGMITWESAGISLRMLPFIMLGALAGRWLVRYIDEKRFVQIALGLTLIASIRLLF
jgi:uncharacterized protein